MAARPPTGERLPRRLIATAARPQHDKKSNEGRPVGAVPRYERALDALLEALLAEVELRNDGAVALDIDALQVVELTAALRHELEESTT